jgi:signal transduction histidine kinase
MKEAAMDPVSILIVDDEAPQMRAICDTLKDHGYAAMGFTSGVEALAEVRPGRFSLLLADMTMPAMDGITLLQTAIARDPDLVGIIMTGAGTIASAVEAMKAGAFDYLLKPFKLSVILPVLARALAMRRLRLENADLQQRVRERTAELEAANAELETFSYSISHDLRAPLRAINGFSDMLVSDHGALLPAEARRLLERIVANAGRMDQLILDLLRFSRIGRQSLVRAPVDMAALVAEVVEEQRREDPGPAEVRIGDLPPCSADPSLVRQVWVNLISNAIKYSRPVAQPVIEVGCTRDGGEDIYQVRDNGVGFDPAFADRLFGVFSRLHTDQQFAGTGVGLSIVRRIVQRHGGRIWAEAQVDQGATFRFTLPPEREPAPAC